MSSGTYRERCFDNRPYICVVCQNERMPDAPDSYIYAHHINGDRSDDRLTNLIPLCMECHNDVHTNPKVEGRMEILQEKLPENMTPTISPEPDVPETTEPPRNRGPERKYTESVIMEHVRSLIPEPVTAREIADSLGCSHTTARKRLGDIVENDDLKTKSPGSGSRIYWLPELAIPETE